MAYIDMALYSYGLYRYALYSYGLYSYGANPSAVQHNKFFILLHKGEPAAAGGKALPHGIGGIDRPERRSIFGNFSAHADGERRGGLRSRSGRVAIGRWPRDRRVL